MRKVRFNADVSGIAIREDLRFDALAARSATDCPHIDYGTYPIRFIAHGWRISSSRKAQH
jgi:hypothetical protein